MPESFHVDLSPPCLRERQRPLPRNLLGRPSVSVAAAFGGGETMKTEKPVPKQPPVSIWANRQWFKDGLLWRQGPAMRRADTNPRFERTNSPLCCQGPRHIGLFSSLWNTKTFGVPKDIKHQRSGNPEFRIFCSETSLFWTIL